MSILQYGCTTWTLTKRFVKKLEGNCTRMLRALLNKSWKQHPTKHQLHGHIPPISKTIQIRRTRHPRHCWRSQSELISVFSHGPLHTDELVLVNRLKLIYNRFVWTQDEVKMTCRMKWTIEMNDGRELGKSVLAA